MCVTCTIWRWVGASNNDPAQGLHTLKSGPETCDGRTDTHSHRRAQYCSNTANVERWKLANKNDSRSVQAYTRPYPSAYFLSRPISKKKTRSSAVLHCDAGDTQRQGDRSPMTNERPIELSSRQSKVYGGFLRSRQTDDMATAQKAKQLLKSVLL